ncbi:uncharacterized serine-rich protein C215.13, partial [Diaphorina citri]|uniref:Lateral signaling target protein 2 homolog n=1 Tax=Diaphorina citri TaxID=121845 RepID=A0A1S3DI92_DIACI
VLWPSSNVCDLTIWKDLYLATTSSNSYDNGEGSTTPPGNCNGYSGSGLGHSMSNGLLGGTTLSKSSVSPPPPYSNTVTSSCSSSSSSSSSASTSSLCKQLDCNGYSGSGLGHSMSNGLLGGTTLSKSSVSPPPPYSNTVTSSCSSSSSSSSSASTSSLCKQLGEYHLGSVCSTEISWEAVEEREAQPTLWIPDHAVNRCMMCDSQFWLGRRKHHCRSCGKIFCADCSENVVALPCEQLYEPVRVCTKCYQINPQSSASVATNGHSTAPCSTPAPALSNSISSSVSSNATLSNSVTLSPSNTLYSTSHLNNILTRPSASPTVSNASLRSIESCKQAAASAGDDHSQSTILSHRHHQLPPTSTS